MSDGEDNLADGQIENGHIPPEDSEDRDSNDEQPHDQFDIDLPTSHRYLGKLDNVKSYTYYENGEIATLPALQTNTLVFPGFTLPLVLINDLQINMFQRYLKNNYAFVLLTPNASFDGTFNHGVIMEIFETQMRNEVLHLKSRSRQRCTLVAGKEIKNLVGELFQVTVRVVLEPPVTSPISNTQLRALKKVRKYTCPLDEDGRLLGDFRECRKYRMYHLAQYPLNSWVYDKHEAGFLVRKMLENLRQYYLVEFIPNDPTRLSYWFVQNYQLKHDERLRIMALFTTVERLRLELKFLKLRRLICCCRCGSNICEQTDVFPMSKDGVQSNYCNPGGFVYETVTVSNAKSFRLIGAASAEFSWFPGYSWTIMQCRNCTIHLGWMFTSASLEIF